MLLFPKTVRKKKARKPIPVRSKFKVPNETKTYRPKHTEEQIKAYAEKKRQERLANRTEAEISLERLIREMGIEVEAEKILYVKASNSHILSFCLADVYCPAFSLILEADGNIHRTRKKYDRGRDGYFAEQGVRTLRFWNHEILKTPEEVKKIIQKAIDERSHPMA
jgi:very-short-patch-repair endonuclease